MPTRGGRRPPGGDDYHPLAIGLYLPASWRRANGESLPGQIPNAQRAGLTKAEIALDLIGQLLDEGIRPTRIVAEEGYAQAPAFQEGISARELEFADSAEGQSALAQALRHFDRLKENLGLDHFEGRNWLGWHHNVGLVFTAYGYRAKLAREGAGLPFAPLNG